MLSEKTHLLDELGLLEEHVQHVLRDLAPGPARTRMLHILAMTRYLKTRVGASAISLCPERSELWH
jgi:hypothetical protein